MKGRIVEWSRERGFGYLECEGRRVFLHWRDFRERHKRPEVGDVIHFELGQDKQGRPCATQAVHRNDGGRLHWWHGLALAALLVAPGLAVHRKLGQVGAAYVGGWVTAMSAITYFIYAWDKRRAQERAQREPERLLHLLELLGGWPGAFLAQLKFRHKSSKLSYQFTFFLIVGLHEFIAVEAYRGWPIVRLLAGLGG